MAPEDRQPSTTGPGATSTDPDANAVATVDGTARWLPPTIARYRVRRVVGEGGMGTVYEAEQDHPRRTVALKVIKPGLANPELLRRFERESQALGRLQHPGIAQIYEAGTADAGLGPQPYFAMEFIAGETLKNHATSNRLDTRQRLELVARICDAVQHAHERALIHRDLKPGNILVDRTGQPKILDFGVARLTDSDAHATRQTDVGQLIGTLSYMSPEQVLADPLELDTRSDVYALGVILYELLAGRLPYTISSRLHEAVQTIREEDPAPLSSISRNYRGDIETIVAKALEKEKTRRYASAAALAEDIRRYLTDQPISARSPSATYQLQKFARRHRSLVTAVAAVFVVLVAGLVLSTWQMVRARRAERTALAAERQVVTERDAATQERNRAVAAENRAQEERGIAVAAQARAQEERNQAVAAKERADTEAAISKAVSAFLQNDLLAQASASEQSGPDTPPDPDLKVRTALDRAAQRIPGKFRGQPEVEASIRRTIGAAYQELGLYPQARQHLERAFELRSQTLGENDPATLDVVGGLAGLSMLEGKYPPAEALFGKALDGLRRARGAEHPDVLGLMSDLSTLYQFQGRYADSQKLIERVFKAETRVRGANHPDTLVTMSKLAIADALVGRFEDAETLLVTVLDAQRRTLGPDHPVTLATTSNLGSIYERNGKIADADATFLKAVDGYRRVLGTDHPHTLSATNDLALFYKNQRRYKEAEPLYLETLNGRRRVLGEEHPDILLSMNNLGALYVAQNRFAEADALLTQVLAARKKILGAEHPNTLNTMVNVAQLYLRMGRLEQAEPLYTEVVAIRRRVLGPEHPDTLFMMANLAVLYGRLGKVNEAESLFVQVLDARRRIRGEEHPDTLRSTDQLAGIRWRRGDLAAAETLFARAFEARRRILGAEHPDTLWSAQNLATVYNERGRPEQAEPLLLATWQSERKVLGDEHPDTLTATERLAELYRRQGKYDQARTLLADAIRVRTRVVGADHPDTVEDLSSLAFVLLEQHKYEEIETLLKDRLKPRQGSTDTWAGYYAESILGAALSAEKKYVEAEPLLLDGIRGLTERESTIPAAGTAVLDRVRDWIQQLYQAWGKPARER